MIQLPRPGAGRILVVGAGPTGLTAAIELTRRGITPRIIDADDGPTPLSKAVGISPKSLDLLEPSGVTARLLERGIRVRRVHLHSGEKELGRIDFGVLSHRFNFLLSLPQSDTESIMASSMAGFGVGVEWGTRFVGLQTTNDGIEVSLERRRGSETAQFSHVFGADGVHSAVRDALGLPFDGFTHERTWSIADIEMAHWPYDPHAGHLFLHSQGEVGFVIPIGENRFRAVSNTLDAMARIPETCRIARVVRTDDFRIPVRQAPTYRKANVFLGGDAAHVQSPVGARGMNLGIEDAATFVRHFFNGTLASYTAERRPVGQRWIQLSERVLRIAQSDGAARARLRDFALRIAGHVPALQKPALERVAGLRE